MNNMYVFWKKKKQLYKKQQGTGTKLINETRYHTIPKIPCNKPLDFTATIVSGTMSLP